MMRNSALQVTNFNFYGDDLIALQDKATGEIYASITQILRYIGFTEKQNEYQKKKMLNDSVVSRGTQKFLGVDLGIPSVNEVICISNRKLPIALTKITITPKMKKEQPELSSKLELYQDKCADVLASVFIDKQTTDIDMRPIMESISSLSHAMTKLQEEILQISQSRKQSPASKYSHWKTVTFDKLRLILSRVNEVSNEKLKLKDILKLTLEEFQDTYDVDLADYTEMYRCEFSLDCEVKIQTLDVINHYKDLKDMFNLTLISIMDRIGIQESKSGKVKRNIFDDISEKIEEKNKKEERIINCN